MKFINDMPPLPKKGRYAKSVKSLVGRDISNGTFKTLKAVWMTAGLDRGLKAIRENSNI